MIEFGIDLKEVECTPERKLWTTVIWHGISRACSGALDDMRWIFSDRRDEFSFLWVCDLLDFKIVDMSRQLVYEKLMERKRRGLKVHHIFDKGKPVVLGCKNLQRKISQSQILGSTTVKTDPQFKRRASK